MPIFEYSCKSCNARFEALVLPNKTGKVVCPKCGKDRLEQLISSFLSPVPGRHKAPAEPHPEYPEGPLGKHHDD
ncbi:MAG TPA: zinc ribbon domain-containing protein [Bryobacteraceae bacterium]|jgi:putative FmdB family regulatory protein